MISVGAVRSDPGSGQQRRSAGGAEYAPVEIESAQGWLKQAEMAAANKNYKDARRLSEQANGMPA